MPDLSLLKFHGFKHGLNYLEGMLGVYRKRTYQLSHFKCVTFLNQYKVEQVNTEDLPNELEGEYPHWQEHWKMIRRKLAPINPNLQRGTNLQWKLAHGVGGAPFARRRFWGVGLHE